MTSAPIAGRPPFRADHIGSLLRPAHLRQGFRSAGAGSIDAAAFRNLQDACITDAVARQEALGFGVVTDGEFRRGSYWGHFVERVEGLGVREARYRFHDGHGHETEFTAPHATGHLRRREAIALDEFAFLEGIARATPKITLPSPSTLHFWRGRAWADPGLYADERAFFAELAAIYRAEIADLAAAGCRYVQLDEVALAMLCDPVARRHVAADGDDPERLVDLYIDAINDATSDRPADMVLGIHLCRGNFKGRHLAEGGYESVAERLFANARADHFLLEFDSERAGDFAPLRFVPREKGVVLGLVSSKVAALEPIDLLQRRIMAAAEIIDLDRLALSPQCGFASTVTGNPLTEDEQWAKLGLVIAAARAIWG
jgi:5-methyltetrahydropteroyltriglutamate--homocysteine methyltransferase